MSCPTCDGTLSVLITEPQRIAWCERCGTVVGVYADGSPCVPALVVRCVRFRNIVGGLPQALADRWHTVGIEEAIAKPEGRKA